MAEQRGFKGGKGSLNPGTLRSVPSRPNPVLPGFKPAVRSIKANKTDIRKFLFKFEEAASVPSSLHEGQTCLEYHVTVSEEDVPRQAITLEKLGDCYLQRIAQAPLEKSLYLKAAALYNMALARCTHKKHKLHIEEQLLELEKRFLEFVVKLKRQQIMTRASSGSETAKKAKYTLSTLRSSVSHRIEKTLLLWKKIEITDDKAAVRKQENDVRKEIYAIRKLVRETMKALWAEIVYDVIWVLGPPPCKYAILSLGEMAVDELTPFSDAKFAVVLERNEKPNITYFDKFATYLALKVISIGETPMTASGVKVIYDFYNKGLRSLFDADTPHGVKIDSEEFDQLWQKLEEVKMPLDSSGLANRHGILVGLPRDVARIQMEAAEREYGQVSIDLLNVMMIEGEDEIFMRYKQNLDIFFMSNTMRLYLANSLLKTTIRRFQLKPHVDLQETDIQLKRVFLELESLPALIQSLRLIHGLNATTEWRIIEALRAGKLLTDDGEHDLKMCVSLAYLLRVRVEMENGGKNGAKHILRQDEDKPNDKFDAVKSIFKLPDYTILTRVYSTLLPLVDHLRTFYASRKKQSLMAYDFYDTTQWVMAHVNYRTHKYDKVIDALKSGVTRMEQEEQIEAYIRLGLIALQMRDAKEANIFFTQALDTKELILDPNRKLFVFVRVWTLMAMVHFLEGRRKRALRTCAEARGMWEKLVGDREEERLKQDPVALEFHISMHELMAMIMLREGKETDATGHVQRAVSSMALVRNPEVSDDLRRARRLLDLSTLNIARCEFKAAVTNLRQAAKVYTSTFGNHRPILQVATVTRLLGEALDGLGKPTSGMLYKANAYLYTKWILGPELPKKPLATYTGKSRQLNIDVFMAIKEGGFCRYAASRYEEALRSFQTVTILSNTINHGKGSEWDLLVGEIFKGRCVENNGRPEKSIRYYQSVLDRYLDKQFYGLNAKNVYIAWCYSHLARVYRKLGMIEEAKENFKTSLAIYRDIVADKFTQSSIADDLIQMAEIYEMSQEYDRAVKLLKECVDIRTQLFGHVHIHQKIATALQKLGLVESHMGDTRSAISHLDQALDMYYRSYGEGTASEEIASVLFDLGIVYKEADYQAKATRSLIKSLEMRKQLHGDTVPHERTLQTVRLLSEYQSNNGDVKDALVTHKYWLKLLVAQHGKSHVDVARVHGLIGGDHLALKKWKEAGKSYESAVRIHRERAGGEEGDTIEVANWYRDLAAVYKRLKKKEKARNANEENMKIRTRVLGRDAVDEDLVDSIIRAAESHELRCEYQKALSYRKKALKKVKLLHGDEPHRDTINCLDALIRIYMKISEYENALYYHNQHMTLLNLLYRGKPAREFSFSLKRSGEIYRGMGKFLQAITQYEAAMGMYEALHMEPHEHHEVIDVYSGLGNALVNMGATERARDILEKAVHHARTMNARGQARGILANALYSMAWANESYPNFSRALELHTEALALRKKVFDAENLDARLAESYRAVGRSSCAVERHTDGMKALTEALVLLRRIHGEETVREDICQVTIELGEACARAGRPDEGVVQLTKALHMLRQLRGTDRPHFHVARCLNVLADVCRLAKKHEPAIDYANQSLNMYREILSKKYSDHPTVASIMTLLGDVYQEMKQYKEAVVHYKRAAHIALVIHAGNDLSKDVERSMKKYKDALSLEEEATAGILQPKVTTRRTRHAHRTN